jgi:hypothetical protein
VEVLRGQQGEPAGTQMVEIRLGGEVVVLLGPAFPGLPGWWGRAGSLLRLTAPP